MFDPLTDWLLNLVILAQCSTMTSNALNVTAECKLNSVMQMVIPNWPISSGRRSDMKPSIITNQAQNVESYGLEVNLDFIWLGQTLTRDDQGIYRSTEFIGTLEVVL